MLGAFFVPGLSTRRIFQNLGLLNVYFLRNENNLVTLSHSIFYISLIIEIGFDPRVHMVLRDDGTYAFDGLFLFSLMPKIDQLAKYNENLRG